MANSGIDWDHYDHGPGSEEWKLKMRREGAEWDRVIREKERKEHEDLRSKNQKLIDICFQLVMTRHDPEFRTHFDSLSREQVAEWVSTQLRDCGFDTAPCGMSWGVLK